MEPHLAGSHELEQRARAMATGGASEICISVDSIFPNERLFEALKEFSSKFPYVSLKLRQGTFLSADLEFSLHNAQICVTGLISRELLVKPILVIGLLGVARCDHPLLGSGTVEEAAEWLEYMTAAAPTALAKERAANGHPEPYKVGSLGIGNESWDCGGAMSPDYYVSLMKVYSRFVPNMNPAQRGTDRMLKIAVGPGTPDTEWTETVMQAWKKHTWSWDINGLSLHWYTVPNGWPPSTPSEKFGIDDYVKSLKSTLFMDEFLRKQEAVMDKYDPTRR